MTENQQNIEFKKHCIPNIFIYIVGILYKHNVYIDTESVFLTTNMRVKYDH